MNFNTVSWPLGQAALLQALAKQIPVNSDQAYPLVPLQGTQISLIFNRRAKDLSNCEITAGGYL